jgi:BirA family biotin operon repressor/biotin-[acetyl-CoA-carboxylase] ligase
MNRDSEIDINGSVVMAEKQLNGKGRLERVWFSSKFENLTFSVLFTDKKLLALNPLIYNFGSVVAVARAIETLFQIQTKVKWPNDLLIKGQKVSGILSESTVVGSSVNRLVVGIGLNVNQTNFQGDYNIPPTSIAAELGIPVQRERVLAELLNQFEEIVIGCGNDPAKLLKDWKDRCPSIGDRIEIRQGDKVFDGIFDDVDETGALILRHNENFTKFHYGDVSLTQ